MTANDTVLTYSARLEAAVARAKSCINNTPDLDATTNVSRRDTINETALDQFLKGLRFNIGVETRLAKPTNLSVAINIAKRIERDLDFVSLPQQASISASRPPARRPCLIHKTYGHSTDECRTAIERLAPRQNYTHFRNDKNSSSHQNLQNTLETTQRNTNTQNYENTRQNYRQNFSQNSNRNYSRNENATNNSRDYSQNNPRTNNYSQNSQNQENFYSRSRSNFTRNSQNTNYNSQNFTQNQQNPPQNQQNFSQNRQNYSQKTQKFSQNNTQIQRNNNPRQNNARTNGSNEQTQRANNSTNVNNSSQHTGPMLNPPHMRNQTNNQSANVKYTETERIPSLLESQINWPKNEVTARPMPMPSQYMSTTDLI